MKIYGFGLSGPLLVLNKVSHYYVVACKLEITEIQALNRNENIISLVSTTDTFLQVHVLSCRNVTMLSENRADTRGSEESALTNDFDDGEETD